MDWKSVKKDGLPEKDCVCVVWNDSRPFNAYIATYSAWFKEFDVYVIGYSRIHDPITFQATHWIELKFPAQERT